MRGAGAAVSDEAAALPAVLAAPPVRTVTASRANAWVANASSASSVSSFFLFVFIWGTNSCFQK